MAVIELVERDEEARGQDSGPVVVGDNEEVKQLPQLPNALA